MYMENTRFSIYTSLWFSWKPSGTTWKTEEFHPLETHTVEAPRSNFMDLPVTASMRSSAYDRSEERKLCVGKPCQNQGMVVSPES